MMLCSKVNEDSKNAIKWQKFVFNFEDNFVSIGSNKFSVLLPEYWYLAVNLLRSSPQILNRTKNVFFYLAFAQNAEQKG